MNVNTVIISGNVVRDLELKYLPNGTAVVQFTIANNNKFKRDGQVVEEVAFIKVTAWTKLAEVCAEYLQKGSGVLVEGRLRQEMWEKDGKKNEKTGIVASRVHFTSKPKERSGEDAPAASVSDEETPF